jgi:hypothetical protein
MRRTRSSHPSSPLPPRSNSENQLIASEDTSWFVPEVSDRLRAANVAVCLGDAPDFPMWRVLTADFVYVLDATISG